MQEHYQSGGGALHARPWEQDQAPLEVIGDDRLKNVYAAKVPIILENHQESSVSSTYSVPLTKDLTVPEMMEHAERIYDRQGHAFRLNLEFGLILRHTETGEYKCFRPFANESLFQRPVYISRCKDLNRLRLRLQRFNVSDYILRQMETAPDHQLLVRLVPLELSFWATPFKSRTTLCHQSLSSFG
jgi:hypothetical protein